ncbi:MAG: hypothetical protein GWO24_36305, partial [Akkermansiaceae bacterium]|nr:hypothetical protein [Akkermansiaceae bacterium]
GGERSFFGKASLRRVRVKMGLLDGVVTPWDGDTVQIDSLEMDLRSGAESEDDGREMFGPLFRQPSGFRFARVEANR